MPRHATLLVLLAFAALSGRGAECALPVKVSGPKGENVPDAVVSLTPLDDAPVPPAGDSPEIMQEDQQFAPYVTVVQTGTTVVFPNRDTVQHHVYSVSKPKRFELPLYEPGKAETVRFDEPGIVALGCNIHDWMVAYLVVVPTPWFGVTGVDGTANIAAPPGRYRLELWHPRMADPLHRDVVVEAGGANPRMEFSVKLRPAFKIRRAPDAKRGGYR